jgi:hypothetical protein
LGAEDWPEPNEDLRLAEDAQTLDDDFDPARLVLTALTVSRTEVCNRCNLS